MTTLQDRTALVTGANRGIGKSIVEEFLRNGASKVYATARNTSSLEPLLSAYPDRVEALELDLNRPGTITAAAAVATDVDIVVNNAGVLYAAHPLSSEAVDTLGKEMEVNVYGLLRVAQAFAPVLKRNGGGVLVQLNSVASLRSFADFSTYAASKAAAYSLTQALRDALAEQGTQVVSVHPGPIATDMANDAGLAEIAEPVEIVSRAIVAGIEQNRFHVFPDTMARQVEAAYQGFAQNVIEADMNAG